MSTNYYWIKECASCGHEERKHIGKSSGGWVFALHVEPPEISSLEDWKERWSEPESTIRDEYGSTIGTTEMLDIITNRRGNGRSQSAGFYNDNHSEPGPNGLMRHKIGRFCVGHGEGTWDELPGEFS